jgi:hypothetical protein
MSYVSANGVNFYVDSKIRLKSSTLVTVLRQNADCQIADFQNVNFQIVPTYTGRHQNEGIPDCPTL